MTSQALYRKWRSQTFEEVIGQEHVTHTLSNALKLNRVTHAYLFAGPRGTGKTSTARLLAKAVNCLAEEQADRPCNRCAICTAINEGRLLDLIEIDAASNTGVDDIRDLRDKVNFRPSEAQIKFYIIDEVHMLSNSAFNALLKTLEEPPEHVIFVLATTEPEKIPATITSRCQRFDFKRIRLDDIVQRLAHIATQEGFTVEPEALEYVARQGGGSMRDAISLMDQLTAYGAETITLDLVQSVLGVVASGSVAEMVEAIIGQDVAAGLDLINDMVDDGADPRQFAREIVEYLRSVMLVKLSGGTGQLNLPENVLTQLADQAHRIDPRTIVRATKLFNDASVDIKSGVLAVPQLPLELAFVEAVTPPAGPGLPASTGQPVTQAQQIRPPTGSGPAKPESRSPEPSHVPAPMSSAEFVSAPPERTVSAGIEPTAQRFEARTEAGGELTLEIVHHCFEQVVQEIEPKNKTMAEALRTTQLYRISGREIHLVTVDLLKERFEKPQPKSAIDEAFSKALGQPVVVRFLTEKSIRTASAGQGGPSAEGEQLIETDELQALLKTAQELGGEVDNHLFP